MRLGQKMISIEGHGAFETPFLDYSLEQTFNDFELLASAKASLESHGSLSSFEMNMVANVLEGVYGRNQITLPSVESHGAFEASLEGAMTELWRKMKNGTIKALTYFDHFFGWLQTKYIEVINFLNTVYIVGAQDILLFGSVSSWIRLVGTHDFWSQFKWNELATFNLNHDKVVSLAILQIENAVELFKNYADYTKTFHDGVMNVLKNLANAKSEKIVDEVKKYNSKTNVKMQRALDKMLPEEVMRVQLSKTLLGGKVIAMGDARNHNLTLVDVESFSHPLFQRGRKTLDMASNEIKFDAKTFNQMIDTAKTAVKSAQQSIQQLKTVSIDVAEALDKVDMETYRQYLSGGDKVLVRNFVRDVNFMIDTLKSGAVVRYYEVFADKMMAAESLVKKK